MANKLTFTLELIVTGFAQPAEEAKKQAQSLGSAGEQMSSKMSMAGKATDQAMKALKDSLADVASVAKNVWNGIEAGFGLAMKALEGAFDLLKSAAEKVWGAIEKGAGLSKLSASTGESVRTLYQLQEAFRNAKREADIFEKASPSFGAIDDAITRIKGHLSRFWAGLAAGASPAILGRLEYVQISQSASDAAVVRSAKETEIINRPNTPGEIFRDFGATFEKVIGSLPHDRADALNRQLSALKYQIASGTPGDGGKGGDKTHGSPPEVKQARADFNTLEKIGFVSTQRGTADIANLYRQQTANNTKRIADGIDALNTKVKPSNNTVLKLPNT